jgi:hypothetical protein
MILDIFMFALGDQRNIVAQEDNKDPRLRHGLCNGVFHFLEHPIPDRNRHCRQDRKIDERGQPGKLDLVGNE